MKKFAIVPLFCLVAVFLSASQLVVTGSSWWKYYQRPQLFLTEVIVPGIITATLTSNDDDSEFVAYATICAKTGEYNIFREDFTPELPNDSRKMTLMGIHSVTIMNTRDWQYWQYDYKMGDTLIMSFTLWGVNDGNPLSGGDNVGALETSALAQNYPNPFNPDTLIRFTLAKDADVSVNIYNIKGQLVKTLVNDHRKAGEHQVSWNGMDDNGTPVSSGVYLYRMQTNEYLSTKRMILLK